MGRSALAGAVGLLPANGQLPDSRSLSHDRCQRVEVSFFSMRDQYQTPVQLCYPVALQMLPEDNID
jgi:hypothetical protein